MAGIKERLIQVILRGKDLLSPEANKSKKALDELRDSGEKLREELDKAKDDNNLVRSLSSLEKESERAQKTADRTAAKVVELRDELNKNPDSKGLSQSLKDAEREAEKAQKALDALKVKTTDLTTAAKAAGIDTRKLSDEEKRLAAELDKAKGAVTDNTKATKDLEQEQRRAARAAAEQGARTTSLGNVLKSAERKVLGYAAAYISLRAATNLVKKGLDLVRSGIESVISVGDGAEKSKIQLEGLMGSIAGGEQATAWIEEFADKSGQRINDVREAFAGLKAYGLDPMDGSMQSIVDKTAQLGGETETLKGISLAIGQMWAKEKIAQEEVNQLRERGVNAYGLLSVAMNKNVAELQDMAKAGQLGRKEIKLLIDEMGRSAEGQAARSLETLSGKWNLLRNQFQKFGEEVASHGAMDVVKEKLQGVLDKVVELSNDGTLNNLAEALSKAFVEGIVKVDAFIGSLAKVDFKTLAQDSADWLNNFSQNVDDAMLRTKLFIAPFRTLFNGITSGISTLALGFLQQVDLILAGVEKISGALPDALGGAKLKESVEGARSAIAGLSEGLVAQIEQDGADIRAAWETTADSAADQKKREVDAVKAAELEKQKAHADTSKAIDAMFAAEVEAGRLAAVEGRRNLEDLADAINVIDATESVAELEKLRSALLKAYQEGRISQQEYEQGAGVLNGKIRALGDTATDTAKDFKTLAGVMDAISKAANDVDIRQAKAALDKLYKEGKINAEQYKKAQEELNKKVAELKPAADKSKKAVDEMGEALDSSGGSLDGAGDRANKASASFEWFMGTINAVREPLEQMSGAAKDAFNELQGIKTAPELDLSSVEGATEALQRAREETGKLEEAMAKTFGGNISDTLSRWATQTKLNGKEVERNFIAQKIELQKLLESYNSGAVSAAAFAKAAAGARGQFNLLDDSDLSALEGAVDAAKQKMDQLADSTKSTLQSLNDELLQLQGTQEEIEKSKMDSRRRDLQSQLADARKDGDDRAVRNLQQALSTLSEIESERERAARNKKAEDAKAEADKAAAAKAPITQKQEPTKIIKLQMGGKSVDVGVGSAGDEAALLSILEQAGLRSL